MLSTSPENSESENSSLMKIWLLGSECQSTTDVGEARIEYSESPYRERGVGGSEHVRHPLIVLRQSGSWVEFRLCLGRQSVCTLMQPCKIHLFGKMTWMCHVLA